MENTSKKIREISSEPVKKKPDWFLQKLASPGMLFFVFMGIIASLAFFGPAEQSLGTNVRVVYLHGAWVWTALIAMLASGAAGLTGLLKPRSGFNSWSQALGRTGLFFWITYLPLSIWAMQSNWNGLYLSEPRWRLAVIFGIAGLMLQIGATLIDRPAWTSLINLLFIVVLFFALNTVDQIMHPDSPVFQSDVLSIKIFFIGLTLLVILAGWQMARWWHRAEIHSTSSS